MGIIDTNLDFGPDVDLGQLTSAGKQTSDVDGGALNIRPGGKLGSSDVTAVDTDFDMYSTAGGGSANMIFNVAISTAEAVANSVVTILLEQADDTAYTGADLEVLATLALAVNDGDLAAGKTYSVPVQITRRYVRLAITVTTANSTAGVAAIWLSDAPAEETGEAFLDDLGSPDF